MDPRLIQQWRAKQEAEKTETPAKRGRKPKQEKREIRKKLKSVMREDFKYDLSDTEEEKDSSSPKPSFLLQTWSGRNPKPTQRYKENVGKRKRHKSAASKVLSYSGTSDSDFDLSTSRPHSAGKLNVL